jgi:hypothetical protein
MAILRPSRGSTKDSLIYTGLDGEITYDTDLKRLRIHDGVTPGGTLIAAGNDVAPNALVGIGVRTVHVLTQDEYDAIVYPDNQTLYIIAPARIVMLPIGYALGAPIMNAL